MSHKESPCRASMSHLESHLEPVVLKEGVNNGLPGQLLVPCRGAYDCVQLAACRRRQARKPRGIQVVRRAGDEAEAAHAKPVKIESAVALDGVTYAIIYNGVTSAVTPDGVTRYHVRRGRIS
eukprot:360433-Chlamydomonas_euryale.AAC.5